MTVFIVIDKWIIMTLLGELQGSFFVIGLTKMLIALAVLIGLEMVCIGRTTRIKAFKRCVTNV